MKIDFDKFKNVTGYDIRIFFMDCDAFFSSQYQDIVNYFAGGETVPTEATNELNRLTKESYIIEPLFGTNSNRLDTIDMWDILDLFSDIQIKLLTANKTSKWMRSSRLNTNNTSVQIDRILAQNETLERLSGEVGYSSPDNEWKDVAIGNYLIEEGYTSQGGTMISLTFKNNSTIILDNIVDSLVGESIKGKDINRKFSFCENDLSVVVGDDCLTQSFFIKLNLEKNSIPEFPDYGSLSMVGSNVSALSFPSRMKDLLILFSQDKRWAGIELNNVFRQDDAVYMSISATTILNNVQNTNIKI